jgi:hypothetical protein
LAEGLYNGLLAEILRIVATVLDFNKEERARTGLDSDGMGWLGGFLRYGTLPMLTYYTWSTSLLIGHLFGMRQQKLPLN